MDYYEHIGAYVRGEITGEDKRDFEAEMRRNPDLKESVEYFDLVVEALEASVQAEAVNTLSQIDQNAQNGHSHQVHLSAPKKVIPLYLRYAVAAVILAVIAIVLWPWTDRGTSAEKLYATYYQAFPDFENATRSGDATGDFEMIRSRAYTAYNVQDYKEAIDLFNEIPDGYAKEMNDALYLGIAYLEESQWENAAAEFKRVADSDSEYAIEARWYLGLATLKTGDCMQARSIFTSLHNAGSDKSKESGEIADKLKC